MSDIILQQVGSQPPHNLWRPAGDPRGRHSGEDTGWASGDDVFAAADGVVEYVYSGDGWGEGWGRRVIIRHTDQTTTTYNHFAKGTITVREGQRVKAGQKLGVIGDSGDAPNGRHLHFEVYLNGVRVNPRPYFSKPLPGVAVISGSPAGGGSTPVASSKQRIVRHRVNGRSKPTTDGKIMQSLGRGAVGNFDGYIRGERVTQNGVTSNIWFRGAYSGDYFWAGNFTSRSTAGLRDLGTYRRPQPRPKKKLDLPAYFFYRSPADAEAHRNPRGGKYGDGNGKRNVATPMLSGEYEVIGKSKGGAFQVRSRANGVVWVSPKAKRYLR